MSRPQLAGELSETLARRGLAAPARLLLDAHRPLRPLLAETAVFLQPVLGTLLGDRYRAWRRVLERPSDYDELIERLGDAERR